jgi:hypothetical protein
MLTVSLYEKFILRRRKSKPVNANRSRNDVSTIRMGGRLSIYDLIELGWVT